MIAPPSPGPPPLSRCPLPPVARRQTSSASGPALSAGSSGLPCSAHQPLYNPSTVQRLLAALTSVSRTEERDQVASRTGQNRSGPKRRWMVGAGHGGEREGEERGGRRGGRSTRGERRDLGRETAGFRTVRGWGARRASGPGRVWESGPSTHADVRLRGETASTALFCRQGGWRRGGSGAARQQHQAAGTGAERLGSPAARLALPAGRPGHQTSQLLSFMPVPFSAENAR